MWRMKVELQTGEAEEELRGSRGLWMLEEDIQRAGVTEEDDGIGGDGGR